MIQIAFAPSAEVGRINAIVFVAVGAAGHENLSGFERGAALAGYRHYKRSARRTWRHPPDASVRLAVQRRARAGLGTAARRAQSAQTHTGDVERSASHTAHIVLLGAGGVARGRQRKRKARVRLTERTPVRGPSGRKEKARRNTAVRENAKERRERERVERVDGRTDGWTGVRANVRERGGRREPVRE